MLDLISLELPEDQPCTQRQTLVEKAQQVWGWLQQFMNDVGEYAGAHVLSMVCAHYPLIDLLRLEGRYHKEVGLKEADDLRVSLLDLSSTVIGDINLCGTSTPPCQPGSTREWLEASVEGDGRSAHAVSTSQAPVAPTSSTVPEARTSEQPEQQALV